MPRPPLYGRGNCILCAAGQFPCALWVANPRQTMPRSLSNTPRLPEDNCEACQHGWVHHQREGAPPAHPPTGHMNRGGHLPTNCGGFFSSDDSWIFTTRCVCSAVLRAHDANPPSNFSATARQPVSEPTSTLTQPIRAYQGVATRPPAPPPLAPIRTNNRRGARAGPTQNTTNGCRVANYTCLNAKSAADDAVAGSSSSSHSRLSGAPRQYPRTVVPAHETRMHVLVHPHCLATDHLHSEAHGSLTEFSIPIDDWERFYTKADETGLVFNMSISSAHDPASPIWRELNSGIKSVLAQANLTLPASSAELANPQFGQLNWVLIKPTNRRSAHTLGMTRDISLQSPDYTLTKVLALSKQKNPMEGQGGGHVVIVAPKHGHILGAIKDFGPFPPPAPALPRSLHVCYADYVWRQVFPHQAHVIASCSEACAGFIGDGDSIMDSDSYRSPSPMAIENTFAHEPPVDRHAHLRYIIENHDGQSDDEWEREIRMDPEADFPDDAAQFRRSPSLEMVAPPSVMEISDHRHSPSVEIIDPSPAPSVRNIDPLPFGASGSNTPNDLLATPAEIEKWASSVVGASAPGGTAACIWAPSAQAAAQALLAVLTHILSKNDGTRPRFQAPEGVTRCTQNVNVASFTHIDCYLRVGRGSGQGVDSAIFHEAANLVSEEPDCWTMLHDQFVLVIKPPNTSCVARLNRICAWGAVLALSMVTQREGLVYTSFGVAVALIIGTRGFQEMTIEYIRVLNPTAAAILEPWYRLSKDAPVPTCHLTSNTPEQNELFALLCALELDPRHIDSRWTSTEHDTWTSAITQGVLFGAQLEICKTQEFEALQEGFNYQLRPYDNGPRGSEVFSGTFMGTCAKHIIATMYIPESVSFNSLWPCLLFQIAPEDRTNVARDETRRSYSGSKYCPNVSHFCKDEEISPQ